MTTHSSVAKPSPLSKESAPLEIEPAANGFSAVIHNADLNTDVSEHLFEEIQQALHRYQVLVFKDVQLRPDSQVQFARLFGHVQVHVMNQYHNAKHPELYTLSNLNEHGKPSGKHPDKGTLVWHTDGSWMPQPGLVTMMYAEQVPAVGGETHFCDMYSAWDGLSEQRQQQLRDLKITHNLDFSRQRRHGEQPMTDKQRQEVPPVTHPLVCRHPYTDRPCVYLGDHAESVDALDYEDGRALIDGLNEELVSLGHQYRHQWQADELVVWDNRCVLHKATEYDTRNSVRVIRRCTVLRPDAPQAYY